MRERPGMPGPSQIKLRVGLTHWENLLGLLNYAMLFLRASFWIGLLYSCSSGWSRVWTTHTGSKSEGELFEVLGDRIGLLIKGREYHFSLSRFIQADQDYVRRWKMTPALSILFKNIGYPND